MLRLDTVCDDTLLNKQYSRVNELAKKQYSGNEHGLVNGICLVNLLWTKEDEIIPVDYRVYQKERDHNTKNDHFEDMLKRAMDRGFFPLYVLIDIWYSSISNLKLSGLTRLNYIFNVGRHFCMVYSILTNIRYAAPDYRHSNA